MPPAVTDSLDIWAVDSQIGADGSISVDFLLPTGIYINLDVPRDATISQIKQVTPKGQLTGVGMRAGSDFDAPSGRSSREF